MFFTTGVSEFPIFAKGRGMFEILVLLAGMTSPLGDHVEVPADAIVFEKRDMFLPISLGEKDQVAGVRVSVSYDLGKTWQLIKECEPAEEKVHFSAAKDGLHLFALQIVRKDGIVRPTHPAADLKVYINAAKKDIRKVKEEGKKTQYKLGADSLKQEGASEGKVLQTPPWKSDVF